MYFLEKRLKALSDKTRLKLIALLSIRPCCVCELAEVIGYAQPTISRHLQRLVEAGFVAYERRSNFQIYRLSPADKEAENLLTMILKDLQQQKVFSELKKALSRADKRQLWEKS